jgi:hypothetical protein
LSYNISINLFGGLHQWGEKTRHIEHRANIIPRVELLVSSRVPPHVADRGMLARYGGYPGNKIPEADQNQYRCLIVGRRICKG